jgi:predicted nucleic acid-binding protein
MTLADTSVWVDHLRNNNSRLSQLLFDGEVLSHPFVIGELACGFLTKRAEILSLLSTLPKIVVAEHDEVLQLLDARRLYGRGLGWVDMHLLASAVLSQTPIWSLDRTLSKAADAIGVAA